jgi:hypothetical protein
MMRMSFRPKFILPHCLAIKQDFGDQLNKADMVANCSMHDYGSFKIKYISSC